MLKIIGVSICAAVCVIGGFYAGSVYKSEVRDLSFLCALISHIEREIEYEKTELPLCYASFRDENRSSFLEKMSAGRCAEALKELKLSKKTAGEALAFFEGLGRCGSSEELKRIKKYLSSVEAEKVRKENESAGKVKSSRVLGVCLASVILLLLI